MADNEKAKWLKRAAIKREIADRDDGLQNVSDAIINPAAGLPVGAVWREENLA